MLFRSGPGMLVTERGEETRGAGALLGWAGLLGFVRGEEEMGHVEKQGRTGQMPGKEREGKNFLLFS